MSSTYFTDSVSDLCQGIVDKADTYKGNYYINSSAYQCIYVDWLR